MVSLQVVMFVVKSLTYLSKVAKEGGGIVYKKVQNKSLEY